MKYFLILFILLFYANSAFAGDISQIVFTTDFQTIKPNEVSGTLTIQAQDADRNSAKIPQTGCLYFKTTSSTGQFFSNNENWNPVNVLTMNKNTANRNFYYKDSNAGNYEITINIALRPIEETRSCASWPAEEWDIKWTPTQKIVVLESVLSPEPQPVSEPITETQSQATVVADSQPEPEVKQEQPSVVVMENSNSAGQPQPQVESAVEPDKKPAKNIQTEIQKLEPKSTTVIDSSENAKQNPVYVDVGNLVSDSQVANVVATAKNNSWDLKKWLMIILGIGFVSSAGFLLIRRQGPV